MVQRYQMSSKEIVESELDDLYEPRGRIRGPPILGVGALIGSEHHCFQLTVTLYGAEEERSCRLVATVQPSAAPSAIQRFSERRWNDFLARLGDIHHVIAPTYLRAVEDNIREKTDELVPSAGSPYQPDGLWEYLAPTHPYDLRTRAACVLRGTHMRSINSTTGPVPWNTVDCKRISTNLWPLPGLFPDLPRAGNAYEFDPLYAYRPPRDTNGIDRQRRNSQLASQRSSQHKPSS